MGEVASEDVQKSTFLVPADFTPTQENLEDIFLNNHDSKNLPFRGMETPSHVVKVPPSQSIQNLNLILNFHHKSLREFRKVKRNG